MRLLLLSVLLTTIILLPFKTSGQDILPQTTPDATTRVETDSVELRAFPLIGITKEFGSTNRLIDEAGDMQVSKEAFQDFTSDLDTLVAQINDFLDDSTTRNLKNESPRELDQIGKRAQHYTDEIEGLQARLAKVANELESESVLLRNNLQRWQLTLDLNTDDEALESRVDRIQRTMLRVDSVRNLLQEDLVSILEQQDELAYKKTALLDLESRVKDQRIVLGETILNRDVPGFFKDLANLGNGNMYRSHWQELTKSVQTDLVLLKSGYMRSVISSLLILVALLAFSIWFKKNHKLWLSEEQFPLSKLHLVFINSPVVSSLFLVTFMVRLLVPDLPRTFFSINILIMMIPMAILMVRIYGGKFRIWIILLALVASANLIYELAYHPGVMLRIILMAICTVGAWLFIWVYRTKPFVVLIKNNLVHRLFRVLIVTFMILQVLAIIANLAGTFRLAEFFALVPIQITILVIAIQIATKFADTILYGVLSSKYLQKLNVIRTEFQLLYRKISWLTSFILLLVFVSFALGILRINEVVYDWGRGVLTDGIKIGAIDISLGSILIFVFVIWLSIMISRIISSILQQDVFTRVKTAKGIPGTVVLLLKIALISGGFFLAAAASGMHLTNLSIVLGAFSVGIGFGLQNIFNNMVSGLILAFERPISVGDVVQVGPLMGRVLSIGLRSSTVKTFDGAEVIVPNGNLISNEMINWTLSDQHRRMDIRVGVAYGTDPERVLAIMEKIAVEHSEVRKKPEPKAYFIEFGDSSLNFRLLAWVNQDNRLSIESEINVLINKELAEAGIEIPFPQRDLHIRSDATKPKSGESKK